jgi:hypothetical protein
MKNSTVCWVFVVFALFQFVIFQNYQISRLDQEIRLAQQARQIESDQIRDLMYALSNAKVEQESIGNRQFVAGVIESVTKANHYAEIWHNGYDRGTANQQYADNLDKKVTLTGNK